MHELFEHSQQVKLLHVMIKIKIVVVPRASGEVNRGTEKANVTRRTFVKGSTTVAAVAVVSPMVLEQRSLG